MALALPPPTNTFFPLPLSWSFAQKSVQNTLKQHHNLQGHSCGLLAFLLPATSTRNCQAKCHILLILAPPPKSNRMAGHKTTGPDEAIELRMPVACVCLVNVHVHVGLRGGGREGGRERGQDEKAHAC